MGKKATNSEKKQFTNLIKLLKPKVYITHSSNFKNLVQQLTGNNINGSSSSSSSSSPIIISSSPPPPPPRDHHHHHAGDQRMKFVHQYQESSRELSVDSSEGSIPSSNNTNTLHEPCFSLLNSNNNNSMGSQEVMDNISEEYYYRNLESWLLEMDSCTTNTSYHHDYDQDHYQYQGYGPLMNIHEDVSIDDYGYDLSTLFSD
ncbi:hypothetical protein P3S68_004849 [Capsicum galapagoense]